MPPVHGTVSKQLGSLPGSLGWQDASPRLAHPGPPWGGCQEGAGECPTLPPEGLNLGVHPPDLSWMVPAEAQVLRSPRDGLSALRSPSHKAAQDEIHGALLPSRGLLGKDSTPTWEGGRWVGPATEAETGTPGREGHQDRDASSRGTLSLSQHHSPSYCSVCSPGRQGTKGK